MNKNSPHFHSIIHMEDKTKSCSFNKSMDPKSGFNFSSRTFHSLRPPLNLPPPHASISAATYALSLRNNSPWSDSAIAFIDSTTSHQLSYSDFINRSQTLANNLYTFHGLTKGHTAFILSPNIIEVPILYFALLSIGVVLSPTNPTSTPSEISHFLNLSKPVIAFTTSFYAHKIPQLSLETILIDSPEFDSLATATTSTASASVEVSQSDVAAILYSSGTTGKSKGVMLTHRNLIATIAAYTIVLVRTEMPAVSLVTVPFFHVFGFTYILRSVAMRDTVVVLERFGLGKMLGAVERFRVTDVVAAPSVVVAMSKEVATEAYDLTSLRCVAVGGAPFGKDNVEAFKCKFPQVLVAQRQRRVIPAFRDFPTSCGPSSSQRTVVAKAEGSISTNANNSNNKKSQLCTRDFPLCGSLNNNVVVASVNKDLCQHGG